MPLQKILFKPGVNKENTRYTTEGGWYECDKIRFRQGNPEKIGGWAPFSPYTYLGVCRSLWNWITNGQLNLIGVGTNLKFYIARGGEYFDVTPIRSTVTLGTDPFTGNGTTTVTVTAPAHGALNGDFVTFSGVTGTYASLLNGEFEITLISANSYSITVASAIPAGATGGSAVVAAYQLNTGPAAQGAVVGWGGGTWGQGSWGNGGTSITELQLWSQMNYGEDLVFGPRGGGVYYWDATGTVSSRGVAINTLGGPVTVTATSPALITSTVGFTEGAALQFDATGSMPTGMAANTTYYVYQVEGFEFTLLDANGAFVNASSTGSGVYISNIVDAPLYQNALTVSDTSRFVMVFGTNDYGSSTIDPLLIRWSNQEDVYNWTPNATNQAGSLRLSHGSRIVTVVQTRQELVVFTDSSLYSLQYLGPPFVWGSQLLGDNVSIIGPNAVIIASGVTYWMGVDKFYRYDGRVQTLNCDLRRHVFNDINQSENQQIFAGTNEGFNEVWWFYCSQNSSTIDRYVVYNYLENIWYYGTMDRTAWLDSGLLPYPIAATYSNNLVNQEYGLDDNITGTPAPIEAYISSSEFDIGDGHNFGFIWRVLPDLTFGDSTNDPTDNSLPQVTMTLYPLTNSGSGLVGPAGVDNVDKIAAYNITEEFTGIVYTRVRGRQLIFKIDSNKLGTTWQLGAPRIDIRPDGRR